MNLKLVQKLFILICIILALIISIIGFSIDFKGYLGNILAEIAGLLISVLVALLIVDRYTEYQRKKRWERVRKLTHQALASHLCDLITELFVYFPIEDNRLMKTIIESRSHPTPETINAIIDLTNQLRKIPATLSKGKSTSDVAVEYYNAVRLDINQIRHELIPRVIQSSDDQDLIDALIDFDDTVQELQNAIILHKRLVTHSAFPGIITLLEKSQAIYEALVKKWE
jgi:hypothetical protein